MNNQDTVYHAWQEVLFARRNVVDCAGRLAIGGFESPALRAELRALLAAEAAAVSVWRVALVQTSAPTCGVYVSQKGARRDVNTDIPVVVGVACE